MGLEFRVCWIPVLFSEYKFKTFKDTILHHLLLDLRKIRICLQTTNCTDILEVWIER